MSAAHQIVWFWWAMPHPTLNHFCVYDKILVFPVAIAKMADLKISNIKSWMQYRQIDFALIANFKDISLTIKTVTM